MDIPSITRSVVLLFALVNQALTAAGKCPLPFSDDSIKEVISFLLTGSASLWAWWKNNSFTPEAMAADAKMKELKLQKATGKNTAVVLGKDNPQAEILLSIQVVQPDQSTPKIPIQVKDSNEHE